MTEARLRNEIARELHDETGQKLTALGMGLAALETTLSQNDLARSNSLLRNLRESMLPPSFTRWYTVESAKSAGSRSNSTHARAGATPGSRSGDDTAMRVPGPAAIEPTRFAALRQIKKPPVFVPGRREVAPEWNCSIVVRR